MPTISGIQSLTTGLSVQNVLLGSQYELAPFDGTIEIALICDRQNNTCSIFSGPDVLQEPGGIVPTKTGVALGTLAFPSYPDDYHWEDEVAQGDRLKVGLVNADAATSRTTWSLRLAPA